MNAHVFLRLQVISTDRKEQQTPTKETINKKCDFNIQTSIEFDLPQFRNLFGQLQFKAVLTNARTLQHIAETPPIDLFSLERYARYRRRNSKGMSC